MQLSVVTADFIQIHANRKMETGNLERRRVNADGVAVDQARIGQTLQQPSKHRLVGLDVDQTARAGNRRMVRRRLRQHQPEKVAQRKRIRGSPSDGAFGVQTSEVADQEQPEIASRRQSWAGPRPRRIAGRGLQGSHRSRVGREFDSAVYRADARHSAAGRWSPPTSTFASPAAVVCPSPSATVWYVDRLGRSLIRRSLRAGTSETGGGRTPIVSWEKGA